MIKILLLDCNQALGSLLKKKGFEVSLGSMGFNDGKRNFPVALYEQNIIFYNPQKISFLKTRSVVEDKGRYYIRGVINETPEVRTSDIKDFFKNSGMLVVFFNPHDVDSQKEQALYSWIPKIPLLLRTKDREFKKTLDFENEDHIPFRSLFRDFSPSLPIQRCTNYIEEFTYPNIFLRNARGDTLASSYKVDNGVVVVLPVFPSNNEVMEHIVTHTYPKLFNVEPDLPNYLSLKKSPKLISLEKELADCKEEIRKITLKIGKLNEQVIQENNRIEKIIKQDSAAVKTIGYLEDMMDDPSQSWYPAFKITETLFDHFGGESATKSAIDNNTKFNFIRKIANESFRDTRHSPKPGEVVSPPTDEEIKKIVKYSLALVKTYLEYLINPKS